MIISEIDRELQPEAEDSIPTETEDSTGLITTIETERTLVTPEEEGAGEVEEPPTDPSANRTDTTHKNTTPTKPQRTRLRTRTQKGTNHKISWTWVPTVKSSSWTGTILQAATEEGEEVSTDLELEGTLNLTATAEEGTLNEEMMLDSEEAEATSTTMIEITAEVSTTAREAVTEEVSTTSEAVVQITMTMTETETVLAGTSTMITATGTLTREMADLAEKIMVNFQGPSTGISILDKTKEEDSTEEEAEEEEEGTKTEDQILTEEEMEQMNIGTITEVTSSLEVEIVSMTADLITTTGVANNTPEVEIIEVQKKT